MDKPQRIGVFGGTFDPPHNAHLDVARAAKSQAGLDKVLFVVSARPPHKRDDTVATPEQRYAMVEAAVADEPIFEACDLELRRAGPSYTRETLEELHERYPRAELFLIIGFDSFADFPNWRAPREILDRAHLLVVPRPTANGRVPEWMQGRYDYLDFKESDLSSTEIRECAAQGKSIAGMVPDKVAAIIRDHHIYNGRLSFDTPRAGEYLGFVRERLPEKTFRHAVSVAETMLDVAGEAGIDAEQAVAAGLLHDACKAMKPEALAEKAREYGISEYLDQPNLLHGPVAAEMCRRELGIEDEDVIDAIRWHTTGRADWNRVGEVLFYADFAEPNRPHPEAAEARRVCAEDGFEAALRYAVDQKFNHVKTRFKLDPHSQDFERWVNQTYSA